MSAEKILKIKPDTENPRDIDQVALDKLGESISDFGDLAGLVCNKRTGEWVCGHQRTKALNKLFPGYKVIERKEIIVKGDKEWEGEILSKDDKPTGFKVRIVDKDIEWQKMANIIANDTRIQGTYNIEKLSDIIHKYESPLIEKYNIQELKFYAPEKLPDDNYDYHDKKGSDKGEWTHGLTINCDESGYREIHKLLTESKVVDSLIEKGQVKIIF